MKTECDGMTEFVNITTTGNATDAANESSPRSAGSVRHDYWWHQGRKAREDGLSANDCPVERGGHACSQWVLGWSAAPNAELRIDE